MAVMYRVRLEVRSRWEGEVHQMRDRGLAFAAVKWPHVCRLNISILVREFGSSRRLVLLS